ncbi:MAG: hypothetical protein M3Q42_07145 [Pseudomonadota bacterium]|nr:hypothetical protein [Pseudomonadota bacterium]
MNATRRNAGNTLFIVIVLLLLASMMSLFAMNVGVFEQRASGSDLRAKLVNEVAEAGLAQGMEYLRQNSTELKNTSGGKWVKCTAADTSFPCGSIVAARRDTMYYWNFGGHDFDGSGGISGWEAKMLPIGNTLGTVNGFPVTYGVGAVLCRVAYKVASTDPTLCTDVEADASPSSVVTLVSVGSLPGEGSRTTLTQTIGSYNILNNPPGKPPIMAAGSVDVTGSLQIVTNPNGGGDGVPVSVWTRKDMIKSGTPNTCYMDEFLRFGAKNSSPPTFEGTTKIVTCDGCACPTEHTLSYQSSGGTQAEGIDILDVDSGSGTNNDVLAQEFPCDMFENVFGVKAWSDGNADYFCETKIMTTYKNPNTGVTVSMGADEAFLYENARAIFARDADAAALRRVSAEPTLSQDPAVVFQGVTYPSSAMSGVIWCQLDCDIGANEQLGSPDHPVLVVIDGAAQIQGRVFGMVFLRATENTLDPATGGSATLDMNAGATVYGSIIVQGQVDKANGTAAIIFNSDVLTNLANDPTNDKFGGIPGGWADDRVTY